jgi:hypothetical protein
VGLRKGSVEGDLYAKVGLFLDTDAAVSNLSQDMKTSCPFAVGAILGLLLAATGAVAGPTNDNFANAAVLTGTNVTVQGDDWDASSEPGEDTGAGNALYHYSVWYTWTAQANGIVHLSGSTTVPNFYMGIRAFRGSAVNSLTAAATAPDGGIPVTPGDMLAIQVASVYYVIWGGPSGATGPFTLNLALEVPGPTSSNDAFANALAITTPTYHFDGSIYGATNEPGEPLPDPGLAQTLWWSLPAAQDCNLSLAVTAPQFTPVVSVYTGTNLASLTPLMPLSASVYQLRAGSNYWVQLAASNVYAGALSLDTRTYAVSNDFFANAELLEGSNITYYGSYSGATMEPGEPVLPATNTVWAKWVAPFTGRVTYGLLQHPGGPGDVQYVVIYTGESLDQLQRVDGVSAGSWTYAILATAGTMYHLQFAGGLDNFILTLQTSPLLPCNNDNFADATVLAGSQVYFPLASVVGASMEPGEPLHMGAVPQGSLWWQWQAPTDGTMTIDAGSALGVPTELLAVYTGDAVQALTLVGKGTNAVTVPVLGSQTYHIAGAVPTNTVGDIGHFGYVFTPPRPPSRIIPGNLLQEPSWEGTSILGAQYWHWSGSLGGYVNEPGGADGTTWPVLSTGTTIWQDIPTIPGRRYQIKFAYLVGGMGSGCCGDALVQVSWDTNVLGTAGIPATDPSYWHWASFAAAASNSTTRVSFQNLARNLEMDAFSVVDLSAPPGIINQPSSISTVSGGTAIFSVGANGSAPLQYQWYFNSTPLAGQTTALLVLNSATTNQSGTYVVTITNAFGGVTSAPAALMVDAPVYPTIVWEPYGDTVAPGSWYSFNVAAIGTPPLQYQWYINGTLVDGATNNSLVLTNIDATNAGSYQVTVQNPVGTVWSLPAVLRVSDAVMGGGTLRFANHIICNNLSSNAPVFDLDGYTPLSGSSFLAQLYAGPSLEQLRPAGTPLPFSTGGLAGYFGPQIVTLANVAPSSNTVVQVRAWDATRGDTYEEARSLGGRFGKSALFNVATGGGPLGPGCLAGVSSFSLQAGLPQFTVGTVQFVERQPPNIIVWAVVGQAGYRYLVEKAGRDFVWQPFTVVLNVTGTVTFTDTASSGSATTFYRARILD